MCKLYNLKASARDIVAVFDALDASGGALGAVMDLRAWLIHRFLDEHVPQAVSV